MIRAMWSFGTVGPIQDLTLEGFYSIDDKTTATTFQQGGFWTLGGSANPIAVGRTPCGDPFFRSRDFPQSQPCSLRAHGPRSKLEDGRGGVRLFGTIRDFTFSLAHYYTWSDLVYGQAAVISPTPEHLLWDLALPGAPATNPWRPNDPTVGLSGPGTPGALRAADPFVPAAGERNLRNFVNAKRVQITGASLSFPLSALTSFFVGPENPLFYTYSIIRAEIAYFRDTPVNRGYHDLDPLTTIDRFLTPTVSEASLVFNPAFAPGGRFANEAGSRRGTVQARDAYAWSIGIDHDQWIRWLNPTTTFFFSAQQFWFRTLGVDNRFKPGVEPGVLNDANVIGVSPRIAAPTGPDPTPKQAGRPGGVGSRTSPCVAGAGGTTPCAFRGLFAAPRKTQLTTLLVRTQYMSGDLEPNLTLFYDWSGAWFVQPGIDWTFRDPFRLSIRYNYLGGRYSPGLGIFKTRDSVWVELQYQLY